MYAIVISLIVNVLSQKVKTRNAQSAYLNNYELASTREVVDRTVEY